MFSHRGLTGKDKSEFTVLLYIHKAFPIYSSDRLNAQKTTEINSSRFSLDANNCFQAAGEICCMGLNCPGNQIDPVPNRREAKPTKTGKRSRCKQQFENTQSSVRDIEQAGTLGVSLLLRPRAYKCESAIFFVSVALMLSQGEDFLPRLAGE